MRNKIESFLLYQAIATQQQQRFYMLRFMWTTIQALEKLGIPFREIDEMRGLYGGFAEGEPFESLMSKQKRAGENAEPPS